MEKTKLKKDWEKYFIKNYNKLGYLLGDNGEMTDIKHLIKFTKDMYKLLLENGIDIKNK